MPNQINDAPLRAQLHTDIMAAHTGANIPVAVHDDDPLLSKASADLPYYVLTLQDFHQEKEALRKVRQYYRYEITGRFPWPVSGTIQQAKIDRANEIMAVITASVGYATIGVDSLVASVDFKHGQEDPQEPILEYSLYFDIQVVDDRSTS